MSIKSNRYRVRDDSGREVRRWIEPASKDDKHSIRYIFDELIVRVQVAHNTGLPQACSHFDAIFIKLIGLRQASTRYVQFYSMVDMSNIDVKFSEAYKLAFKLNRPNWVKAFAIWKEAAEQGHVRSQFYLATCYDSGKGTSQDLRSAFNWYMKAAKAGHPESQYNVGFFYRTGEVGRKNYTKMVYWYQLAANAGDTEAQRDLGAAIIEGQGIKADYSQAVYWYKKAAKKGDARATYNLGLCFFEGDGVNRSIRWAKYYLTKAAQLGHTGAKRKLKALQ